MKSLISGSVLCFQVFGALVGRSTSSYYLTLTVDNDNGGFWFVLGWYNSLLFLESTKKEVLESSVKTNLL
jgi:hypothetical protein